MNPTNPPSKLIDAIQSYARNNNLREARPESHIMWVFTHLPHKGTDVMIVHVFEQLTDTSFEVQAFPSGTEAAAAPARLQKPDPLVDPQAMPKRLSSRPTFQQTFHVSAADLTDVYLDNLFTTIKAWIRSRLP